MIKNKLKNKPIEAKITKACLSKKNIRWGTCGTLLNEKAEPIATWEESSFETVKIISNCK